MALHMVQDTACAIAQHTLALLNKTKWNWKFSKIQLSLSWHYLEYIVSQNFQYFLTEITYPHTNTNIFLYIHFPIKEMVIKPSFFFVCKVVKGKLYIALSSPPSPSPPPLPLLSSPQFCLYQNVEKILQCFIQSTESCNTNTRKIFLRGLQKWNTLKVLLSRRTDETLSLLHFFLQYFFRLVL